MNRRVRSMRWTPSSAVAMAMAAMVLTVGAIHAAEPAGAIDPDAIKNLDAAYPQPPAGMERKVILLPHKERDAEAGFRVEVVVGKTVVTDGVNSFRFGGELREVDIPGWGFSYWQAEGTFDSAAQTRIGGPTTSTPAFVAGPSRLVAYNSRLPLVVMVPEGCEVRWRTWKAAEGFAPADDR